MYPTRIPDYRTVPVSVLLTSYKYPRNRYPSFALFILLDDASLFFRREYSLSHLGFPRDGQVEWGGEVKIFIKAVFVHEDVAHTNSEQ